MSGARAFRLILAVVIAFPVLRAMPAYSWHGQGTITDLAIDPQNPAIIYAATTDRGVFKTTDGGATWSATGLATGYVSDLAIDPQMPTTIYAAIGSSGVLKSTDGGGSWSSIGTGLANTNVSSLALDLQSPGTLYAVDPEIGVFKSTDGGATWNASLRTGSFARIIDQCWYLGDTVFTLAIDPQNSSTLYASVHYYTPCEDASFYGWAEVLKSTDGGATWYSTTLENVTVGYLAIAPETSQTPTTVYAGSDLTVFKSTDGGAIWVPLTIPQVPYPAGLLVVDPRVSTTLYAVVSSAGVFKSMDAGATWNAVSTGLVDVLQAIGFGLYLYDLAIDPQNPNTLYLGTVAGVFKSTDGGGFWVPTGLFQHSPLASMSLNPTSVISGTASTGTVTLATAAPLGGVTVTLSSSNLTAASVPASVTVPAGAVSANFTISTSGCGRADISATFDGATRSATLGVVPPATLSSLSLNPRSVSGGSASTGTVTLNGPAPVSGTVVMLSSDKTAVATVPTSVTVAAGSTSANFTISTSSPLPSASIIVTIRARHCDVIRREYLEVTLPVATTLTALSLDPISVTAGSTSTGRVILDAAAPTGGAVVALYSSSPSVAAVPASVTVPAGATSAIFGVSTFACTPGSATISGTYGGVTKSAGLTVTTTPDTVAIQMAEYFARRGVLRVEATSTGSTARLWVYDTSTSSGTFIGELTHYDGDKYRGQFAWKFASQMNPQITVQSNLCGWAKKDVTLK